MENRLKSLGQYGQAVWLDYIHRHLITSGELAQMIEQDGLLGITSNPSIFQKSIAGSKDYDPALKAILAKYPKATAYQLYECLAIEDIKMAADILLPVYQKSRGQHGLVSLEVSPHLAYNTTETIAQAKYLWGQVARPNLMIKVPATIEGIVAIEALIAEGINVNVTLIFSVPNYLEVADAYCRGIARCAHKDEITSVASFFISRIDTEVDRALQEIGSSQALALRGRIAIATAKIVYQKFLEIFHGKSFADLKAQGVRVQYPLWASTSTKNPLYRDVLYVEELIGADTVNTIPPVTLQAFRDHGIVRASLMEGVEQAKAEMEQLASLGVDLEAITARLQKEGVKAFVDSFDSLVQALDQKTR